MRRAAPPTVARLARRRAWEQHLPLSRGLRFDAHSLDDETRPCRVAIAASESLVIAIEGYVLDALRILYVGQIGAVPLFIGEY
jgi:hypothetical protein